MEGAETKTAGLALIWRGTWPCFKPQLLWWWWWGLQHRPHGPLATAFGSMSRSESGGVGLGRQESVAIVGSHRASVRLCYAVLQRH